MPLLAPAPAAVKQVSESLEPGGVNLHWSMADGEQPPGNELEIEVSRGWDMVRGEMLNPMGDGDGDSEMTAAEHRRLFSKLVSDLAEDDDQPLERRDRATVARATPNPVLATPRDHRGEDGYLYKRTDELKVKAAETQILGSALFQSGKPRTVITREPSRESSDGHHAGSPPVEAAVAAAQAGPAASSRASSGRFVELVELDVHNQVGQTFYHRIETDHNAPGADFAEAGVAKSMLQALRLRRRYMERSCQHVPIHVETVIEEVKRYHHEMSRRGTTPNSPGPGKQVGSGAASLLLHSDTRDTLSPMRAQSSTSSESLGIGAARGQPSIPPERSDEAPEPGGSRFQFTMKAGVVQVFPVGVPDKAAPDGHAPENAAPEKTDSAKAGSDPGSLYSVIDYKTFVQDMRLLQALVSDGPSKSIAFKRCQFLAKKFHMHCMLNDTLESAAQRSVPHRDFYNVRKVDTHVHLSACMNQKHLLRFIKKKIRVEGDQVVIHRDGRDLTLKQVFETLNTTAHDLSIDALDMHAGRQTFHRFDRFNAKYNPIGSSRLREIFLKTANMINGRYYAEVCKEVIDDLEDSKYQHAEYRISIYGRDAKEWDKLAGWFADHNVRSPNVRWLIQTPRLYYLYAKAGKMTCFEEMIANFFLPLFEATVNPEAHPKLTAFLAELVGFDSVDDESKPERTRLKSSGPTPDRWTSDANPPYAYYLYYWYANISVLNQLRRQLGLNVYSFRPHCGEAGPVDHVISGFLCAEGINHGICLRKVPVMQYLYYLAQIPIAMSPLSNNQLFLDIQRSPFKHFFDVGMNVSLSTDDPLQFHMSKEPLIEEYAIATQIWKLNSCDQAELCANSVRQSGFPYEVKQKWLGKDFDKPGPLGNDIKLSNVPDVRLAYR